MLLTIFHRIAKGQI